MKSIAVLFYYNLIEFQSFEKSFESNEKKIEKVLKILQVKIFISENSRKFKLQRKFS